MKQLLLFADCSRRSSAEMLRTIRAMFLRTMATGRPADAGEGQQSDPYPPGVRNAVGPMIAALRRERVITPAGADYASRPSLRKTIARLWQAVETERCKRLADADEAWLSAHKKNAGESAATDSPAVNSSTYQPNGVKNDGQVV